MILNTVLCYCIEREPTSTAKTSLELPESFSQTGENLWRYIKYLYNHVTRREGEMNCMFKIKHHFTLRSLFTQGLSSKNRINIKFNVMTKICSKHKKYL